MSAQEANIPTLLKDIESFMDSRMDHRHMKSISDALNSLTEVPLKVKHKIFENLSHSDSKRIMRCLDLFEYLTHHSPSKLLEIIREPKFIEIFPYTMSEDDLKEVGLNILKIWSEKFQPQREQLSALFDFIGNLDMFDIHLPSVYKPRFEEEIPKGSANNYTVPANISVDALLERAKAIRKESRELLDDQDSEELPSVYLKPVLEVLLEEYKNLLSDVLKLGLSEPNGRTSYQLTNILSELDEYEARLTKKLADLEEDDNEDADSQKTSDINTILTLEEFSSYKINPCKDGKDCPHYDEQRVCCPIDQNPETACPFWHSHQDRRRAPVSETGKAVYDFEMCSLCDSWEPCFRGDECGHCHNYYEEYFHPRKYKTSKCIYERDECETGKYCPDYHTTSEKRAWKEIVKKMLKPTQRKSSTELLYDQLNDNNSAKARSGNASRGSYDDFNSDPIPAGVGMEAHLTIPYGMINYGDLEAGEWGDHDSEKTKNRNLDTKVPDEKRTEVLNGHLHSKLVIKRDYLSPQLYTKFFNQNPCFNGVPLMKSEY